MGLLPAFEDVLNGPDGDKLCFLVLEKIAKNPRLLAYLQLMVPKRTMDEGPRVRP